MVPTCPKFKQEYNSRKRSMVKTIVSLLERSDVIRISALPTGVEVVGQGNVFSLTPDVELLEQQQGPS